MGQAHRNLRSPENLRYEDSIDVSINGKIFKAVWLSVHHPVGNDIPAETSLNTFIREHVHLKGTKFMCLEGGCGACIVTAQSVHPQNGEIRSFAVNSCLLPIFVCHGWSITTIEGLGSEEAGYHDIQARLAAANGTQCGYCSPGMVMNMNSLLERKSGITKKLVENSFGGNICRCTGYRPILDAFKSFAIDAPGDLVEKLTDIEDMHFRRARSCDGSSCGNKCASIVCPPKPNSTKVHMNWKNGRNWFRPTSVKEVFEIFDLIGDATYRMVCGNTGHGVYRIANPPDAVIDLNGVGELFVIEVTLEGISLGSNVSLSDAKDFFDKIALERPDFAYCSALAQHIDMIANVPVRNVGSMAGNLSLKRDHPDFPSDVFLLLETVNATITIGCLNGTKVTISPENYLTMDMRNKLILTIDFPPHDNSLTLRTFKIMPRAQNAHAYVNAGFFFNVNKVNSIVQGKPNIVYGGISPDFVHAKDTEAFLEGKELLNNDVLSEALKILEKEVNPNFDPSMASVQFRKGLAQSLFYKFVLSIDPGRTNEKNRSGGSNLERPVSGGRQNFDTDRKLWPITMPVPKIEGLIQCAGEAEYTNDRPNMADEVWAQLVLCDRASATIKNIDPSEALKMAGVLNYIGPDDIPGENCFLPVPGDVQSKIFATDKTDYAGQAVGAIIAETREIAHMASLKVKVNYGKGEFPVLSVAEIVDSQMTDRIREYANMTPTKVKDKVIYKVKGRWHLKGQYHFTMETLSCVVVPKENQIDVHASTQDPSVLQSIVSHTLDVPASRINVIVRRVGGGYGAKIDRPNQTSAVCALAAHLMHRPVRMVLNLETNMEWMGKRPSNLCDYEAGVDETGEIKYLNASIYQDHGHVPSKFISVHSFKHVGNGYDTSTTSLKMYGVLTDNAWNTWCRAPGSTEQTSFIENLMEHVAKTVNKNPVAVRLMNFEKNSALPKMIRETLAAADYEERLKITCDFNQENRWKKRGLNVSTMCYPFYFRAKFHAHVSISSVDGTVSIFHGGVEIGQGINTKAAQVAAKYLDIPLEMIYVKPTNSYSCPNNSRTGGCQATDGVCYAIMICCQELNKRLDPFKKAGKNADWMTIINAADAERVNLHYSYMFTPKDNVKPFNIYGVVVTEVEIDVLTGQFEILRVDLHEDAGQSISPQIDIGQVEGSFVMGLGYYTTEELKYCDATGALLTNRTWNYKPPGAKDIPADFRVTLKSNAYNPNGVLGSKATGEPPLCLSCSVVFALRDAIISARQDGGYTENWIEMSPPYTVEKIWTACQNSTASYVL